MISGPFCYLLMLASSLAFLLTVFAQLVEHNPATGAWGAIYKQKSRLCKRTTAYNRYLVR